MSEWLFAPEPAQEGLFNAVSKLFHRKGQSQSSSDEPVRILDEKKLMSEHPLFKRGPINVLDMWFSDTEPGKRAYAAAKAVQSSAKSSISSYVKDSNSPSSKEVKMIKVRGIDVSWDPTYYEFYLWIEDEMEPGNGTFDQVGISDIANDLVAAGKAEPFTDEWYGAQESWLFGSNDMEPAQEANAFTKWALNKAKHTGSKSKLSTEQRKTLNSNIKNYINSHDPGEIARLAAQLYSKRSGFMTGDAGKKACEGIAQRQTSRKAKNVTIEMMGGLYYVTCTKPGENGGEGEFMFYAPQVNGVYSRTLHQMAFELVGAQGKSAYATESWLFD